MAPRRRRSSPSEVFSPERIKPQVKSEKQNQKSKKAEFSDTRPGTYRGCGWLRFFVLLFDFLFDFRSGTAALCDILFPELFTDFFYHT